MKWKNNLFFSSDSNKRKLFRKYRQIEKIDASLELDQPFVKKINRFEERKRKKRYTHFYIDKWAMK